MRLTVFNGSPRGKNSNTKVLLDHFLEGFVATHGNAYELVYLIHVKEGKKFFNLFQEAEEVLLAFPLYTDAMPAIVKTFIELLEPLCGRAGLPAIGFIVQSGFPESTHSQYIKRYLEKLAGRLGCLYKGTVIKGGVEGIRVYPLIDKRLHKWIIKIGKAMDFAGIGHLLDKENLCKRFYMLGKTYGETGEFDKETVKKLTCPERLTRFGFLSYRVIVHNLYWDLMLKKNSVFEKRDNRPFS